MSSIDNRREYTMKKVKYESYNNENIFNDGLFLHSLQRMLGTEAWYFRSRHTSKKQINAAGLV